MTTDAFETVRLKLKQQVMEIQFRQACADFFKGTLDARQGKQPERHRSVAYRQGYSDALDSIPQR